MENISAKLRIVCASLVIVSLILTGISNASSIKDLAQSIGLTDSGAGLEQEKAKEITPVKITRNIKVMKLVVDQRYVAVKKVSLPFESVTRKILQVAGFKIVGNKAKSFDATFTIKAIGEPQSSEFADGKRHYANAFVKGTISICVSGSIVYEKLFDFGGNFHGFIPEDDFLTPDEAPFDGAFWGEPPYYSKDYEWEGGSFPYALSEVMEDIFGILWNEEKVRLLLLDNESQIRWISAGILGKRKIKSALDSLIVLLKNDKDREVRASAAWALGKIGNKKATKPLIDALEFESDSKVSNTAIWALGKIKDPQATIPLIAALKHSRLYEGYDAAEALGEIGDVRAVEPLIDVINSELKRNDVGPSLIFYKASLALGKIGDKKAVKPLIDALKHS